MRRVGSLLVATLVLASALSVAGPATAAGEESVVAVDVAVSPDPAPPGTNVTVNATVENVYEAGDDVRVQRVALREGRERNSTLADEATPREYVGPGGDETVTVAEEFDESGSHERYVHVRLLSGDGDVVQVVRPVTVEVEQAHPAVALSADDVSPAGKTEFALTVANGLPDAVRGLAVDVAGDDVTLLEDRRVVSSLEPGEQAELTVPAEDVDPGVQTLEVTLSYLTADGESRTLTETLTASTNGNDAPGNVTLTGLRVSAVDEGTLEVRGSASNVGSTNASAVLVEVADGDGVSPGQDQASYFVGEVAASDYSSFQVHADLEGTVDGAVTVPLSVSYDVDGERVTRTVEVEYAPDEPESDGGDQQASFGVVPIAAGGLVVLVLVAGVAWRRFR